METSEVHWFQEQTSTSQISGRAIIDEMVTYRMYPVIVIVITISIIMIIDLLFRCKRYVCMYVCKIAV